MGTQTPSTAESSDKKSGEKGQAGTTRRRPRSRHSASRASPPISFSPANIHLVAELKGGPDDYEEFYCPAIEWDWGDGTRSENSSDCDPHEAGVSQISRRFSKTHVYNLQGRYRVQIRLKRNTKVLTSASTNVQVRAGIRDMGPYDGETPWITRAARLVRLPRVLGTTAIPGEAARPPYSCRSATIGSTRDARRAGP